ncbi:MAG TPA: type II toxin-antitoxin system RelE/ParE family toxin [Anaerolineae bacterium]|nr:type II toxin-antitoxin system RelE/ParE family toxin [Anaerolineae bacterium]
MDDVDTPWELVYYRSAQGRCPVEKFIQPLSPRDRAVVIRCLQMLEKFGTDLGYPHTEKIHEDIYCLRVRVKRSRYRFFYFMYTSRQIVLLHAIQKKTRAIPRRDIRIAIQRRDDRIARFGAR